MGSFLLQVAIASFWVAGLMYLTEFAHGIQDTLDAYECPFSYQLYQNVTLSEFSSCYSFQVKVAYKLVILDMNCLLFF